MTALHSASILASALLLFLIEPMVAKALLPLYGGSPAVWNTCLLFFQGLLLAGYAYAHFAGRYLGRRGHLVLHAALLLLPIALLPPHLPSGGPPPSAWPVPSLLLALALAVGLPFFILSTNSSMVQAWHAARSGRSPYFLYAASNAGSFVALMAYPFLVEPLAGTRAQLRGWSIGYLAFVAISAPALWGAWRARATSEEARPRPAPAARRWRWALRAAVPSSLLLAVSLRITTDVAAIPLFWVLPLALYLVTFILAFWPRLPFPRRALVVVGALGIALQLGVPSLGRGQLWLSLAQPLALLLVGGWLCHGDLARDRPEPEQVTEYYLWIAVGGFAGGVFGNLVAPLLFNSIAEFPLSLALLAILFSVGDDHGATFAKELRRPATWLRLVATGMLFLVWVILAYRWETPPAWFGNLPMWLLFASLLLGWLPGQFAAASLCSALLSAFVVVSGIRIVEAKRSFFGVARVREDGGKRRLVHGTTWHGMQRLGNPTPLLYYVPLSPLSRAASLQPDGANLAVVGLGTGSVAHYVRTGQTLRFYELDPIIEPLARRWFTFLDDSAGQVSVQLGDARLTLAELPEASLDMLLVDAFSSDAIPVHLMTVEAVQMYMARLKPDGFVVFHISNRHLDLKPVLRAIAKNLKLSAAVVEFDPDEEDDASQVEAVALARSRAPLQKLYDRSWEPLGRGREVLWTDDRSSLLSVIVK
jgi:SAM-dependent methyltransferase